MMTMHRHTTKFIVTTFIVMIAATAALGISSPALANGGTEREDLGAGPIAVTVTPCLIALKSRVGAPCSEPPLRAGGTRDDNVADRLARARYFIDLQDFPKSLGEIDEALKIDPTSMVAAHMSARLGLTLMDFARAERDIAVARAAAPDNVDVRATYAMVLQTRGAGAEAMVELSAIIESHPDHLYSRLERAKINLAHGMAYRALNDISHLVAKYPTNFVYRSLRAQAYLKLDQPLAAIADLTAALETQPGAFPLLVERARAYERSGDDRNAVADLTTILGPVGSRPAYAIAGDGHGQLLMQRAMILVRLLQFADAASDMMTAVSEGGRPSILRAQIFLRQNGFPNVPLDGRDSSEMRAALQACFGLNSCFQAILRAI